MIIFSFQWKKRDSILIIMMLGQLLFVVHYGLLSAWTAATLNCIAALRGALYSKRDSSPYLTKNHIIYIFITAFIIAGYYTWEGPRTLLFVIAQSVESIIFWIKKPQIVRLGSLAPRPLYFSYNFIVSSYAGILVESFLFCSVLIGIARFDLPGKSKD